jgi:hypothetical protein
MGKVVLPSQRSSVDKLWVDQKVLMIGPPKVGKCHAVTESVIDSGMGVLSVKDISQGTELLGPDGNIRSVVSVHKGKDKLYRIKVNKHKSFTVTGEHNLYVVHSDLDSVHVMSVKHYLSLKPGARCRLKLVIPTEMSFSKSSLPLEPYFLGLWLGDGVANDTAICNIDEEIIAYIFDYAKRLGLEVRIDRNTQSDCNNYSINGGYGRSKKAFSIRAELRKMKLLKNKHIPESYLKSSKEERLALLAGLIDSDGYVAGKCGYEICLNSEKLCNDIKLLASSLGFGTNMRYRPVKFRDQDYSAWRVSMYGPCSDIPVLVNRKKVGKRKGAKSCERFGFTVEELHRGDFIGFELDKDQLYLDSNTLIHHNSEFWSHGDKTLYIQCEPGLNHLSVMKLVCNSWDDFGDIYSELVKAEPFPYDTIVVDTVDRLVDYANDKTVEMGREKFKAATIYTVGDIPNGAGWYWTKERINNALGKLNSLPACIVLIGHLTNKEVALENNVKMNMQTISLSPSTGSTICAWSDHILNIEGGGKTGDRKVRTRPSASVMAGSRGDMVPENWVWTRDSKVNYEKFRSLFK